MKCNCCDRDLSDTEIVWNPEINAWEMCSTCLDVAMETAYSQGFHRPDEDGNNYVELGDDLPDPEVAILDGAFEPSGDYEPEQLQFSFRGEDDRYD